MFFFWKSLHFLKLPFILIFSILLLPMILFLRLLRPFVLIRFGSLISTRIGHYAANTELYLCEKDAGLQPKHAFDIFFNDRIICNYHLKKMWDRTLNVCQITRLQRPLYIANRILPGSQRHEISLQEYRDIHGLNDRIPSHLSFTSEEKKEGYEWLRKISIPEGAKFVCFHARDESYLNRMFSKGNWYYHKHRDSNIDNYIFAAEELVKRGYYTFRMGSEVEENLRVNNSYIIDYATRFRTEFLDIYLGAMCEFFICSAVGIFAIPVIFRKPVVFVNFIPLIYVESWYKNSINIFKRLWLQNERRFMTFREILVSGAGSFNRTEQYEQAGIEVVENTADEIRDVTIEMDERLKGTWQTTEEDEELQQRFWSLFKSSKFHGVIRSRIGRDFLRQNKDLLE